MIEYLRRSAHPEAIAARSRKKGMQSEGPEASEAPATASAPVGVVPETVSDSIRLWESENRRMELIPSALYESFDTPALFHATEKFAQERDAWLWSDPNPTQYKMAVKVNAYDDIRAFIKQTKANQSMQ